MYPNPKEGVKIYQIHIKTPSHTFLCVLHDSDNTVTLFIGGEHTYCIHLQAYKPNSTYDRMGLDIKTANMHELLYDQYCSLTGQFRRKIDTEYIFRLGISVLRSICKWVNRVKFIDASHRECASGASIDLHMMNYLVYGKTWYERNFNAYLSDEDALKFKQKDNAFQALKTTISWDTIKSILGKSIPTVATQSLWEESDSWQSFFRPIFDRIGPAEFCEFSSDFLNTFKMDLLKYNFTDPYFIDLTSYTYLRIEATPYRKPDKASTRKLRKSRRKMADMETT